MSVPIDVRVRRRRRTPTYLRIVGLVRCGRPGRRGPRRKGHGRRGWGLWRERNTFGIDLRPTLERTSGRAVVDPRIVVVDERLKGLGEWLERVVLRLLRTAKPRMMRRRGRGCRRRAVCARFARH